jgi:hypothetical protein
MNSGKLKWIWPNKMDSQNGFAKWIWNPENGFTKWILELVKKWILKMNL